MKNFLCLIMIMILSLFGGERAFAQNAEKKSIVSKEVLKAQNGEEFKIALIKYTNHHGDLEVRIEAAGIARFASKINPVLGFGRDLDQNQKIDTWFLVTKKGIELFRLEGADALGRDILGSLLQKNYQTSFSMYATSAATSILSYLFMSVNEGINIQEEYYRDWMDLEESRILFEEDMLGLGSTYTFNQLQYHNELISLGFKDLANRMDHFAKQSFWGYAFADIGLWITGGIVINWTAKILTKLGLISAESAFINSVKETLISFFDKQRAMIDQRLSILKNQAHEIKRSLGMKTAQKQVTTALSAVVIKQALAHTIKSQKLKKKLRLHVLKTLKWPINILKGAKSEWKYIGLNVGVQVSSEAMARYDEIYDENPLTMSKNLLTNPDVIQNVGFMTSETLLMTGISKNLKTTKARYMASGAVALTNTSILNFAIKDEANLARVAFDTSWEAIVGNAQVQLDLKALEYFEKMALKKNNPKIKLVGYVIALVDMGAGYFTYSKISSAIEGKNTSVEADEPRVMLVPVLAEI